MACVIDFSLLRALFFDLDGVVWRGNSPVPGAAETIQTLQNRGIRCFYATNNSSRTPEFFVDKLGAMNIRATPDEIVTSSTALALYVQTHFPAGASVYIVGESGIASALENVGAKPTFDDLVSSVDLVVAGIDREFTYAKLHAAQRLILAGAKFVATNRDATFPLEEGVGPGAGSIVAAVETASGIVPISMGKPEPTMLQLLLERLKLRPEQAAMIGDRLDTDIACAHRAGVGKIFVATGVTPMETARAGTGEFAADVFVDDLPALLKQWDAAR